MLFFWLLMTSSILLCELYIPYRRAEYLGAAAGAFVSALVCSFGTKIYIQSLTFAAVFALIFVIRKLYRAAEKRRRIKGIALCDILDEGKIFSGGRVMNAVNLYPVQIMCGETVTVGRIEDGTAYICLCGCKI